MAASQKYSSEMNVHSFQLKNKEQGQSKQGRHESGWYVQEPVQGSRAKVSWRDGGMGRIRKEGLESTLKASG